MTEDELREIEARANAATPGPWRVRVGLIDGYIVSDSEDIFGGEESEGYISPDDPNAIFTAHARTDVPALIAEIRRLRRIIEG